MGPNAARRRRHLLLPLLVATAAFAACSGGDDAAPTTTLLVTAAPTTPAPTTVPTTTLPPTTTTPPPTTQPPTTAPFTTAPPTSVDPASAEAIVAQVMADYIGAVNDLNRDPANQSLRDALGEVAAGYPYDLFIERADESVLERKYARVDPANPSRVEPILVTFAAAPNGDPVVGMDGCVIDTDTQVTLAEDGSEIAAESTPDSLIMTFTFTSVDDRWMVTDIGVVEQYPDQVGCG